MTEFDISQMASPEDFIWQIVIPSTNKYIEGDDMTLQEFYVWLGCHFFTTCFEWVEDKRLWWSKKSVNMFDGAPFRLWEYMSGRRFKRITAAMRYTNVDVPPFLDRFHDVRQMIGAFNDHYELKYSPVWLNCLDELMNSFLDKFCPGFMCVPYKSHPFGNKYHSISISDGST